MSQRDWTPIRRVAEMLNLGHRNKLTLLWARELGDGQADQAIAELERRKLVTTTLSGVEPTVAFGPWLAELRRREDQPEAVKPATLPPAVPQTAPQDEAPVSATTVKRKRYFAHLSRDRYQSAMEMAARIKELIQAKRSNNGTMRLSALKRSLHADRHPEVWKEAIRRLVVHRIAKVANGEITLKPTEFDLPDPYGRPKPKRRRRNRGQSEWYQMNRTKMDDGQHSNFDEDWEDEDQNDEDDLAAEQAFWRQLDNIEPED